MKRTVCIFSILLFVSPLAAFAQERMSLEAFLNKVREQNLDLKVESAKSEAAQANAVGLAIPPPMAGVSQMREDTGNTADGFEISQSIPFPTKLTSDRSARQDAAKSQEEMRLARASEVLAKAKLLYFSLWASQERLGLLRDKRQVLENHIKLARSSARSDSFAGIHLLKTESDRDLVENDILSAEQNVRERQVEIAVFINADSNAFRVLAEEPPISFVPKIDSLTTSHQIRASTLSLESFKSRESEARASWFPDINLRYKEMGTTRMFSGYKEVMVGVTLPFVFFWEPNSAVNKATAERNQAEYELEKQKREIEAERVVLISKAEALKKQLETLTNKLIPRAEKRMKLVHNLAPRDMETLQDHRETMEAFPDLKMKRLELRMEFEQAISSLEKYISQKGSDHE
ncbi:MAG: TolC family protein [Bdellovibrionales bacterium]